MSIAEVIAQIRAEQGLTQEQMARRLYVTRQAVSRWETGETSPGIDMVKLICVTFGVPLERFFDMPASYFCQCCSMPIADPEMHGTEADGTASEHYCKYCYDKGAFTSGDVGLDEYIESIAQIEADALGISREEAVSLLGATLPQLERWREARERWGETDAYKEFLGHAKAGEDLNAGGEQVTGVLATLGGLRSLPADDPRVQEQVAALQSTITSNFYRCTDQILAGLGQMYAADPRFAKNIDQAGGPGTAAFASEAIAAYCDAKLVL